MSMDEQGVDMKTDFRERASYRRQAVLLGLGTAFTVVFAPLAAPLARAQSSQTAEATTPAFEVASIKPNHSNENMIRIMFSPGRFTANGVTIKELIKNAYHVKDDQLSGMPGWVSSDRYDIEAKMTDATAEMMQKLPQDQSVEQHRLLIQSLLTDRFKLKVGHETKDLPVYALVVAKNGPKLVESTATPTPPGPNPPPLTPGGAVRPGMMRMGRGELAASAVPVSFLADVLSGVAEIGGRVVVDETGLKGKYDLNLHWAPEGPSPMAVGMGPGPGTGSAPGDAGSAPTPDSTGPSIFTALQEQLGLKLEPRKGPVQILVIENIEKPSED
jgi:uncharacterized protein (TIGR03435 family)